MDLRQIRYFLEVARSGSFSLAASRLHIAQSALSRRIKDLEIELGAQLLERDSHGARPTDIGRSFMARTSPLLRELEMAREEVIARSETLAGQVTIGTSSAYSPTLIGDVAATFGAEYPRLKLNFIVSAQYALYEALDTGSVDLAVMLSPNQLQNCIVEPLIEERLNLVVPVGSGPSQRRLTLADLANLPLVMFPRPSGIRTVLDQAADAAGIVFDVRYELTDLSTHLELVHRNLAYAIMSRTAIRDNKGHRRIRFAPIEGLSLTRTLVHRNGRVQSPAVKAVADVIRRHVRQLTDVRDAEGQIWLAGDRSRD